jgi:hypothetical protein
MRAECAFRSKLILLGINLGVRGSFANGGTQLQQSCGALRNAQRLTCEAANELHRFSRISSLTDYSGLSAA